ncbi:MAG TPA: aldose 1-epimerase family protein [Blastococcus sp.]|jgi:aldose 1-epimerase|nr:aldose 1-epimerase family protein [Blastococcus sp.]
MNRAAPPSGLQFRLQLGSASVVIAEVGGGLRSYSVDGRELLDGYGIDQMCTDARGQTFIPWPNRIADGRYEWNDEEQQLPLTEPPAHNAIHGLTRWANWHASQANHQSLRLHHTLHPQPGYPFALRCELGYVLSARGLRVETQVTNIGAVPCPYATGAHPYLTLGTERVDDLTVEVPARTYYPTDDRGIPVGRRPVEGTEFDLRRPVRLGDRVLDHAFTDLDTGTDGGAAVTVRSPAGRELQLWMDGAYRYVELFTGDTVAEPSRRRRGLGVEPMTAAPNAFCTGDGLLTLEPGQAHTSMWELRPGRS